MRSWFTLHGLCMDISFVEFRQLREVGVFSYLVIPCLKSNALVLDFVRSEMAMDFDSKEVEPMLDEGDCPWIAHGLIWDC